MADGAAIKFETLETIVRVYQERGRRAMVELAPAIAESLHFLVMEEFETEGRGRWPGFWWERRGLPKPAGRRWQGSPKLLRDTGVLANSLTPNWDERMVEVYTNVPYAKYHVSPEPRTIIPRRDFLDIDREAFEGDVADMILDRIGRAA